MSKLATNKRFVLLRLKNAPVPDTTRKPGHNCGLEYKKLNKDTSDPDASV